LFVGDVLHLVRVLLQIHQIGALERGQILQQDGHDVGGLKNQKSSSKIIKNHQKSSKIISKIIKNHQKSSKIINHIEGSDHARHLYVTHQINITKGQARINSTVKVNSVFSWYWKLRIQHVQDLHGEPAMGPPF
jgi:hypothetical protein